MRSFDHCCGARAIIITYSECIAVALGIQYAKYTCYCHLWPVWLYNIFPHALINGTIKKKKLLNIKCVFSFSLQILILRRTEWEMIKNIYTGFYAKYTSFFSDFNETWIFLKYLKKNTEISIFMKIHPVGAELFHLDGRTDRQTWWS